MRAIASVASALLAALLVACSRPPTATASAQPQQAATGVRTIQVVEADVPRTTAFTGSLRATQEAEVAAGAAGLVTKARVERGSALASGQVVVELDARQLALVAEEARANLASAQADAEQASKDCERDVRLLARGAITKQEDEKAQATCRMKDQALAAARSRTRRSDQSLADATVRAPFAGVVSERYVSAGEWVQQGAKVAHLVQTDPLRLELTAPEALAGSIRQGQEVTFTVSALPGRVFGGTVAYVAPSLRSATRDLVFEALVKNGDGALKPGMFATATLAAGTERLVVVPKAALHEADGVTRLYVVKDGRVEARVVETGSAEGATVALRKGAAAGEQVVVEAPSTLIDGMAVR
jgi:membrane fusion protein (multidrug efflux system)